MSGGNYFDNLHNISDLSTKWTRANSAEALPGVQLPLSWDFWELTGERAKRGAQFDIGLLEASELETPEKISDRIWAIFYGRVALNTDFFHKLHSRSSKADADAHARQVHGVEGQAAPASAPTSDKEEGNIWAREKALSLEGFVANFWRTETDAIHRWWRDHTAPEVLNDTASLGELWIEAQKHFERINRMGASTSTIAIRVYGQLRAFCERVGKPELETKLTTGLGDTHDTHLLNDIWNVAHGGFSLEQFVAEHGYNGHGAGSLNSRVWRENPELLKPLVARYAALPDSEAPDRVTERAMQGRAAAEKELLDAAGPDLRAEALRLIERAAHFTRLRELGKVMFLHPIDVARAASRARGTDLARKGLLDNPEDIFYLLRSEVMEGHLPSDAKDIVAFRRARHAEYSAFDIPQSWTGNPVPFIGTAKEESGTIKGLGVSSGRAQGKVRLVLDPMEAEPLEPGEILVCHTTDPSWGPFFFVAGGLVIDIGGSMSHGAIIAREIGVPCVINTGVGTKRLKTGDQVIVDGDRGAVEILPSA